MQAEHRDDIVLVIEELNKKYDKDIDRTTSTIYGIIVLIKYLYTIRKFEFNEGKIGQWSHRLLSLRYLHFEVFKCFFICLNRGDDGNMNGLFAMPPLPFEYASMKGLKMKNKIESHFSGNLVI